MSVAKYVCDCGPDCKCDTISQNPGNSTCGKKMVEVKANVDAHCEMKKARLKATSKNVIPAKAGIQKLLTLLDSRLRGSDKFIITRDSLRC